LSVRLLEPTDPIRTCEAPRIACEASYVSTLRFRQFRWRRTQRSHGRIRGAMVESLADVSKYREEKTSFLYMIQSPVR